MTEDKMIDVLIEEMNRFGFVCDTKCAAAQHAAIKRFSAAFDKRATELLTHNNELLDRARKAEAEVKRLTQSLFFGAAIIGELSRIGAKQ